MILKSNFDKLSALVSKSERVLDVGGWSCPFHLATHVLDVMPYETRHESDALDPQNAQRFTEKTWTIHDACKTPWPFPDKYFDFVFCSNMLEDVRDPLAVCAEMIRVSKAGYLETPSRTREIFSKARGFFFRLLSGCMPEIGFYHHRWFVELDGTHLRFTAKDQRLVLSRHHFITRGELGRKMTEEESGIGLFWNDSFTFEENFLNGKMPDELKEFKKAALQKLRSKKCCCCSKN